MDPVALRLLAVVALVAAVALVGRWARARDGRVVLADGDDRDGERMADEHRTRLGLPRGSRTAVLFGSATCAPCDAVKALLHEVERDQPGFRWTYVDAADHLDVAAAHRVRRVPTLLVVDGDGAVAARTAGVPDREELRRAVGGALAA